MLEILKFMFSNFWVWLGFLIIITTILGTIVAVIPKIFEVIVPVFQYTRKAMLKRAVWDVFNKDIKENDNYNVLEKITYMYCLMSVLRKLQRCKNIESDQQVIDELIEQIRQVKQQGGQTT